MSNFLTTGNINEDSNQHTDVSAADAHMSTPGAHLSTPGAADAHLSTVSTPETDISLLGAAAPNVAQSPTAAASVLSITTNPTDNSNTQVSQPPSNVSQNPILFGQEVANFLDTEKTPISQAPPLATISQPPLLSLKTRFCLAPSLPIFAFKHNLHPSQYQTVQIIFGKMNSVRVIEYLLG